MEINEYEKWKRMLLSGIIFAFITMILGEIPVGWVKYPETGNVFLDISMGSGNLTIMQIASGIFFGGIFIPLQYYGFKAIAEILSKTECKRCAKAAEIGAKAVAFGGGTVHIIYVALMFVCRMENTSNLAQIPQSVIDFTLWLTLPISAVFMAVYIPMTIAMAVPVVRGKTAFPRWAVVFNPLTGKIILNILAMVLPNSEFINGVRMSNMGIGSLITFAGWRILLEKYQKTEA